MDDLTSRGTLVLASAALLAAYAWSAEKPPAIRVDAGHAGVAISPSLYGIFFEEINHAGDGGLYAELVRNRSFEDSRAPEGLTLEDGKAVAPSGFTAPFDTTNPLPGWRLVLARGQGAMALDDILPLHPSNPHALRLEASSVDEGGHVGVANEGFWGMCLRRDAMYELSLYARAGREFAGTLTARLEDDAGHVLASHEFAGLDETWRRLSCTLTSADATKTGKLVLAVSTPGIVWLDMVSLFPKDTWRGRPNGLRPDLAEMLAEMQPAFVRFPGGCFVEGVTLANALRWKTTIGDLAQRPGRWNLWNYRSSDGLGYFEYLQMSEDLGAEPLLVINCGMSCQARGGTVQPLEDLEPWVQDALDAVEYANGPTTSTWGALRAAHGHPEPFNLKYIEIGNENSGPEYDARYLRFYRALKARYPEIQLIANADVKDAPADIRDDHYYMSPDWFRANTTRYDHASRSGPKVYVGEFACVGSTVGKGNLRAALAEAAFMMGFERNADLVVMSSYAPLFVNVNDRTWNPDAIGFDNASCYGTPSYHVQKLFALHRGDVALPTAVACRSEVFEAPLSSGAVGLGTWHTAAEFQDLRVTQGDTVLLDATGAPQADHFRDMQGAWKTTDGVLRQSDETLNARAYVGDPAWTDYTVRLKARKLSGAEGFLVMVRAQDDDHWIWINLGGWGNTHHGVEKCFRGTKSVMRLTAASEPIQVGRWYDIEVTVKGHTIACALDGAPILEAADLPEDRRLAELAAMANRVDGSGELILKVVNFADEARATRVVIENGGAYQAEGDAVVLTSHSLDDENSLEEPLKVAPRHERVHGLGPAFDYTFEPFSLTILRLVPAS